MKLTALLVLSAALGQAHCIQVSSSQVMASDLAGAIPLFQRLDPDTPLGFAPAPGVQRIFTPRELVLAAWRFEIEFDAGARLPSVCVERAVRPLNHDELLDALRAALDIAAAHVELLDFGGQPAPPGPLEFLRATLPHPPADAPESAVVWRGRRLYDGQRSVTVWAKVRVTVDQTVREAAQNIPAGATIGGHQVREIETRQFPFSGPFPSREQITGKIALRNIAAGQRFTRDMLGDPKDVRAGDTVHVRVTDGLAALALDAVAQSSGNQGETVQVHNPSSGKNFRAQVEGKGRVVVNTSEGTP